MEAALMQATGRRMLSDCTVVGSVGVGGSIALLLLIGFAVGAGVTGLFFWWRERRRMRIELEYRDRFGDAVRSGLPDVSAMVKAAHTPTISRSTVGGALTAGEGAGAQAALLAKAAAALAPQEGPLAMGAVSSFKQDPLREAGPAKEQQHPNQRTNPLAGGPSSMARSGSGNPFAGEVPSFCVRTNDACSLNNTPASSMNGLPLSARIGSPEGGRQAGLIGTSVYMPAADPSSPRITQPAAAAGGAGAAAPGAAPSTFGWPALSSGAASDTPAKPQQPQQPTHVRSDTVVVKPASEGGKAAQAAAAPAAAAPKQVPPSPPAPSPAGRSSDYLAALDSTATNPFETPALRRQQEEESGAAAFATGGRAGGAPAPSASATAADAPAAAAAAKAAQKQELLQAVQEDEYEAEELDTEWGQLLGDLDGRLQAAGRPWLSAKERAVAIRSLIVATASQSAEAALSKAQHDVEAYRRAQARRAAA